MTAVTDHNYNWRLHRRVWLAWPGPGSQLRSWGLKMRAAWERSERGACTECQLPIHHGDTGPNIAELGVMLINIYPQCSHYYEETRWIVLVLIIMGHIRYWVTLRFEYNPVFEWVSESIHHIAQHSDQAWRGKRGSRGLLSVSDVWWPVSCPTSLTPGSPQPRPCPVWRRRRGNWYLRFCFNSSLLVCIQIRYAGSFSHIIV